jgi:anaerobic magnesium-protoporphyrin IX monomethyl ester cyclase
MSVAKIILFNPRSSAGRTPVLPMSLLAIGAVLEERFPYVIVDGNLIDDAVASIEEQINGEAASTVLAVTVMPGPQLEHALPVCRELRESHPGLTVVWAGYFPSQHWDSCLRSPVVDYVVRGHGERVFSEFLEALDGGRSFEDIEGLAWRDPTGVPKTNKQAPVPHPAELPEWNLDRVPMERYLRDTFLGRRTVGYASSYGCPYFCNFCAVVNMVGGKWRAQSARRVAEVFETYQRRWGIDAVELNDNNFFVDERRVADFSDRIKGLQMTWWGEGRVDTLLKYEDASWRVMRNAGLRMIFLGAESGSAETLQRMDKGGRLAPEMTLELVEKLGGLGIVPELSFVLGNPPDPEADAVGTMDFIRRVKKLNPLTEIILYMYTPVPLAGDLYNEAKACGFAFPETLDEWVGPDWLDFVQRRSDTMPWVGRSLQSRIRHFERVLNAYYPTSTMTRLTPARRALLRAASAWRYRLRAYAWPFELDLLHRVMRYQRPETSGF